MHINKQEVYNVPHLTNTLYVFFKKNKIKQREIIEMTLAWFYHFGTGNKKKTVFVFLLLGLGVGFQIYIQDS